MELIKLLFDNNIYRDGGGNYYCGQCFKSSNPEKILMVQDSSGTWNGSVLEQDSEHIVLKCPRCDRRVTIRSGIN